MSCCSSSEPARAKEVNKHIKQLDKAMKKTVRLLLLGAGESGKSTFTKQLKRINVEGGFDVEERKSYTYFIYRIIYKCVMILATCVVEQEWIEDGDDVMVCFWWSEVVVVFEMLLRLVWWFVWLFCLLRLSRLFGFKGYFDWVWWLALSWWGFIGLFGF